MCVEILDMWAHMGQYGVSGFKFEVTPYIWQMLGRFKNSLWIRNGKMCIVTVYNEHIVPD